MKDFFVNRKTIEVHQHLWSRKNKSVLISITSILVSFPTDSFQTFSTPRANARDCIIFLSFCSFISFA